jgi:hypothetical protein
LISIESAIPRLNEFIERQTPTLNTPGSAIWLTYQEQALLDMNSPVTICLPWFEIQTEYISNQLEPGLFRVVDDPRSPEFIRFEVIIDGKAVQAILSGGVYSRTFTL